MSRLTRRTLITAALLAASLWTASATQAFDVSSELNSAIDSQQAEPATRLGLRPNSGDIGILRLGGSDRLGQVLASCGTSHYPYSDQIEARLSVDLWFHSLPTDLLPQAWADLPGASRAITVFEYPYLNAPGSAADSVEVLVEDPGGLDLPVATLILTAQRPVEERPTEVSFLVNISARVENDQGDSLHVGAASYQLVIACEAAVEQ